VQPVTCAPPAVMQVVGSAVAFLAVNGHRLTNDFARASTASATGISHNYRAGIALRGIRDGWLPKYKMVRPTILSHPLHTYSSPLRFETCV
jgi:hypothetical protein